MLLGKPDCHLCHEMQGLVEETATVFGARLEVRDVRDEPQLERRYVFEIPVLLADGVELVRHRTTRDELRTRLTALGWGSGGAG